MIGYFIYLLLAVYIVVDHFGFRFIDIFWFIIGMTANYGLMIILDNRIFKALKSKSARDAQCGEQSE